MANKDRKTEEPVSFDEMGDLLASPDAEDGVDPEDTSLFDPEEPDESAHDQTESEPEYDAGFHQEPEPEPDPAAADPVPASARAGKDRVIRAAGVVFLLLGVAAAVLTFLPERYRPASFPGASALLPTPLLFVIAGLVLGQFASLRRRTDQAHARLEELVHAVQNAHATTRSTRRKVRRILGNMRDQLERPPASGEELSRVLGFMQKQDEKLVNLNHATKMYGKAFVDLSGKLVELRRASESVQALLEKQGDGVLPGVKNLLSEAGERIATRVTGHLDTRLGDQEPLSREAAGQMLDQTAGALLEKTTAHVHEQLAALGDLLRQARRDLAQDIRTAAEQTTRAGGDEVAGILLQCESIQQAVAALATSIGATPDQQEALSREDVGQMLDQTGAALVQKTATHLEQQVAGLKELLRESREDVAARIRSLASLAESAAAAGPRERAAEPPPAGRPDAGAQRAEPETGTPQKRPAAHAHAATTSKSAVTGAIARLRQLRGS